jgi:hypothetical protein
MKYVAVRTGAILALFILASCALPAHAQFNAFGPSLGKINGGMIWGSLGSRDIRHPGRFCMGDRRPEVRGGFALLYGPFGGRPDTTVTLDSVRTMVEWLDRPGLSQGATRVDTVRAVRTLYSRYIIPGRGGWVLIGGGYQYSGNCTVDLSGSGGVLAATFPVGGFYGTVYFGPFPVWRVPRSVFWSVGLGAGLVQLNDASGTSDSTLVRFDTERALAPEAALLLGWRVHRGLRVRGGLSARHIRWSAIRYRTPAELPLPDAALRRLPDVLGLTTVYVILGVEFDASELFARR